MYSHVDQALAFVLVIEIPPIDICTYYLEYASMELSYSRTRASTAAATAPRACQLFSLVAVVGTLS